MAEIKKIMEKDEKGIDRQIFPETVPEAVIGLEKIIKGEVGVLSVNSKTGVVNLRGADIGITNEMLLSADYRSILDQIIDDYRSGKLGGSSIEFVKVEREGEL
jgi:hypothetical protein